MQSGLQLYHPFCLPKHNSLIDLSVFSLSLSTEGCSGCCITRLWPQQLVFGVHEGPAVKLFLLYAQMKGLAGVMCWRGGCCGNALICCALAISGRAVALLRNDNGSHVPAQCDRPQVGLSQNSFMDLQVSTEAHSAHYSMTHASVSAGFTAMSASQRILSAAALSSWVAISSGGCSSASRCSLCRSWLETMPGSAKSVRCSPLSACAEVCGPLAVCRSRAG